ncbi:MAG: signal peptidase II, partial [Bacteroidales bacterium]|nr:signal peptidase II [Bacteroidales bacterium]
MKRPGRGTWMIVLGVLLVIADQIIKVLVKTGMSLGETIYVAGEWFQLHFVLNKGMAFGMAFGGVTGKVLLSLFRLCLFAALFWWIGKLARKQSTPIGVLVGLTLIAAGALGNIIDCFFYGLVWPETIMPGAPFPFMFGQVVDMFYFPLFTYRLPQILGGGTRVFFDAVFNFADSCVTCGAFYLLFFQYRFFAKEE